MKLLSVNLARSIWLFILNDLNPRGYSISNLSNDVVNRYKFASFPKADEDFDLQKGVVFQLGAFQGSKKQPVNVNLTVYNDGFVADTRSSTIESDEFLDDVFSWLSKEYGYTPIQEIIRSKVYSSEIYIRMNKPLNALNPKLKEFAKHLSSKVEGYVEDILLETGGISFMRDPGKIGRPGPFKLEKQEGIPFEENRYYSLAPLQTEAHIELLKEFERILS